MVSNQMHASFLQVFIHDLIFDTCLMFAYTELPLTNLFKLYIYTGTYIHTHTFGKSLKGSLVVIRKFIGVVSGNEFNN